MNSKYTECASSCSGSCRDLQIQSVNCEDECIAGCKCDGDMVVDDRGYCTDIPKCTCYNKFNMDDPIVDAGTIVNLGCAPW